MIPETANKFFVKREKGTILISKEGGGQSPARDCPKSVCVI